MDSRGAVNRNSDNIESNLEIVNNTVSGVYTNEYKSKSVTKKTNEYPMKTKTSKSDDKILGIGFLHEKNSNMHYGMCAKYADDYSEDNPVIKIIVTKPNGKEEYRINASDNGYFTQTNEMDSFENVRQDWMTMVHTMIKDYINAGLYKQSLDGKGLLGIFERYLG